MSEIINYRPKKKKLNMKTIYKNYYKPKSTTSIQNIIRVSYIIESLY